MSKKRNKRKPSGVKRPRMSKDETISVVDTLGDILNSLSLALMYDMSVDDLRNLAIRKGNEAEHLTVKNICFNLATAPDIERSLNVLRARLGDALH